MLYRQCNIDAHSIVACTTLTREMGHLCDGYGNMTSCK